MNPVTSILVRPHGVVTGRSTLRISMTVLLESPRLRPMSR